MKGTTPSDQPCSGLRTVAIVYTMTSHESGVLLHASCRSPVALYAIPKKCACIKYTCALILGLGILNLVYFGGWFQLRLTCWCVDDQKIWLAYFCHAPAKRDSINWVFNGKASKIRNSVLPISSSIGRVWMVAKTYPTNNLVIAKNSVYVWMAFVMPMLLCPF